MATQFGELPVPVRPRLVKSIAYHKFVNPFSDKRMAKWEATRVWCLPEGLHSTMSVLWPEGDPSDWICVPPESFEAES